MQLAWGPDSGLTVAACLQIFWQTSCTGLTHIWNYNLSWTLSWETVSPLPEMKFIGSSDFISAFWSHLMTWFYSLLACFFSYSHQGLFWALLIESRTRSKCEGCWPDHRVTTFRQSLRIPWAAVVTLHPLCQSAASAFHFSQEECCLSSRDTSRAEKEQKICLSWPFPGMIPICQWKGNSRRERLNGPLTKKTQQQQGQQNPPLHTSCCPSVRNQSQAPLPVESHGLAQTLAQNTSCGRIIPGCNSCFVTFSSSWP